MDICYNEIFNNQEFKNLINEKIQNYMDNIKDSLLIMLLGYLEDSRREFELNHGSGEYQKRFLKAQKEVIGDENINLEEIPDISNN